MRATGFVITAAVAVGLSGTAFAQGVPAPPNPVTTTTASTYGPIESHWIASGFVGSNFGNSTVDPSVTFGGQIGYLWHGYIGVEALGDFAPEFKLDNALLADDPHVASYMANAIAAVPIGHDGRFQPYVSGGLGAIQMSTRVFNAGTTASGISDGNQARLGVDLGGGVMGYGTHGVGFRADIRYYKATTDNNFTATTPSELFTQGLLSGVDFWRASAGVVWRW
jgi:opacity protein-like surface antigen